MFARPARRVELLCFHSPFIQQYHLVACVQMVRIWGHELIANSNHRFTAAP